MAQADQTSSEKLVLCPYCGHAQFGGDRCEACGGLFEPLSRRATQLAMGPWQIRDKNNPFRPGCCYDVIKKMAAAGKIKSTTVMRGPTTRQFWSVARNVPGVAHLIGYCHACGSHVSPSDAKCGECGEVFTEPRERNTLGLHYKTDDEARRGQETLDAEIRGEAVAPAPVPGKTKRTKPKPASADDLLAEVLDLSGDVAPAASPAPTPQGKPMTASVTVPTVKPKAIDFAASPQSGPGAHVPTSVLDIDPTAALPESGGISTSVYIMIAANIIAIATIIVLVIMLQ